MGLQKTEAIVIGSWALGESDRIIAFYTRAHGKLRGVAKAARRPRSRFGGALELFSYGTLVFFEKETAELVRINGFDVLRHYRALREDLTRLGWGAWMVECLSRLTPDRDPSRALFALLRDGLRRLAQGGDQVRIPLLYALRLLDLLGHRPQVTRCLDCGRSPLAPAQFESAHGGVRCRRCGDPSRGITLSGPALTGFQRLQQLPWESGERLRLTPAHSEELHAVIQEYFTYLVGQPSRSLRFLANIGDPARIGAIAEAP